MRASSRSTQHLLRHRRGGNKRSGCSKRPSADDRRSGGSRYGACWDASRSSDTGKTKKKPLNLGDPPPFCDQLIAERLSSRPEDVDVLEGRCRRAGRRLQDRS